MKLSLTVLMSILAGLVLTGCLSSPDADEDNRMRSDSLHRGLDDPDNPEGL